MPPVRFKLEIKGIVQGVGFRPFVYNLAERMGLRGTVRNDKLGVTIEVQGNEDTCKNFMAAVENESPPLARISQVKTVSLPLAPDEKKFKIITSDDKSLDVALIAPDSDVCPDCLAEMLNPADRRYRYPFINCTNCGPRYTIIEKTPYDRQKTSMSAFEMCAKCRHEYEDPKNRRFHAQPNACPACGPALRLLNSDGGEIKGGDPISDIIAYLDDGRIAAIKGLGGYHLACDATNEKAVAAMRERKMRKEKPFAVMSKDLGTVRTYADVGSEEEKFLLSREKPVVLLGKKNPEMLAESIAPGLMHYGVFLPYTPLHHLLFSDANAIGLKTPALVMTSGNLSDEPIVFDEGELLETMSGIADFFLVHNRPIVWRCDDSVVRAASGKKMIARRSRGFVPEPVFLEDKVMPMLACGGDLKNVFCLAFGNTVFPGPHIGDLENAEAFRSFRESIRHFKGIFEIEPQAVAVDMHPGYFSSKYGRSLGLPVIEVQHHHAHIASVMAEHSLEKKGEGKVIGLALDGTGYGDDGTIWGGEALVCDLAGYRRAAHFPALVLPGGDAAAKEPWRTAAALIYEILGEKLFDERPDFVNEIGKGKIENIIAMVKSDVNCPKSTGAGRLFDAAASMLMIKHHNRYEGQAPMMLEAAADKSVRESFDCTLDGDGTLDFKPMLAGIISMAKSGKAERGAAMFHNTIAKALAMVCEKIRDDEGLSDVCLGGGVWQNAMLLERTLELLAEKRFTAYLPRQMPVNDGGIALGQIAIANRSFRQGKTV